MKNRILSLLTALLTVFTVALSGCTDKPDVTGTEPGTEDNTVTAAEEDTGVHDNLPEMNFNNYTSLSVREAPAGQPRICCARKNLPKTVLMMRS